MPFVIDPLSFLLGLVAASVFWWVIGRARPLLGELRDNLKQNREAAQARRSSGVEENHRRITLRRAQGMHLAAPLFALDEIIQEPRLLAPLASAVPGTPPVPEEAVSQTLPYLPAWPEVAAVYRAASLTIPQALACGRNIVITGHAGSGKTVALAHLASLAANRAEALGDLREHIPFLLHVADLRLPVHEKDVLSPIIEICDASAPVLDLGRLPGFVTQAFRNGRALLLLDGFDELPVEAQSQVSAYLGLVLRTYPATRIVTTGTFENLDGLFGLKFAPLAIAGWDPARAAAFTQRWGELWSLFVSNEGWLQGRAEPVDPLLLNSWVEPAAGLTPLELTLKLWAAYAGDSLGPRVLDAVSTHIRRLAPANMPPAALDTLALQVVLSSQPVFDTRMAGDWVRKFEPVETTTLGSLEELPEPQEPDSSGSRKKKDKRTVTAPAPSSGLLNRMAGSGLLVSHAGNRMRFAHPVFEGYLSGRGMSDYSVSEQVLNQPDWVGKILALRYLAAHGDMNRLVDRMLEWSRLPTHRPLLAAARWLRDAPRDAPWRGKVMAALVQLIQTEGLPLALRGQAMAAFVFSNDPGAPALFRQLMNTLSFELVQLCALGSGALHDPKAIKTLEALLGAPSLGAQRAACLALAAIGSEQSLEIVAHQLLSGDEASRRAAAEALANDPVEGHAMLRDGTTLSDILVRHAVVYGLARIDAPWATELLQQMQIEDEQWVVRNAATHVLEQKSQADPRVPRTLPPPSESPWLIEFASTQGVGIPPGSPATDLLVAALKSENSETRLASVAYLVRTPTEGVVTQLYHAMYSDDPVLREVIYLALMELAASGIKLPHPSQFGLA